MHNHSRDHAMHALTQLMRWVGISLNSLDIYNCPSHPVQPKIRKINMEKYKIRSRPCMAPEAHFPG